MKMRDGTVYKPTGKRFDIRMVTFAHWKYGRIQKEYLFWDGLDWNKQIGLVIGCKSSSIESIESLEMYVGMFVAALVHFISAI